MILKRHSAQVLLFLATIASPLASASPWELALDSEIGKRLTNAPENSWIKLNVNAFQDTWTPYDQRPKAPDSPSAGSPRQIIQAWSSMAWDSNRGDLIIWGGGHANYPGNEVYRWRAGSLQWERASLPSEVVYVRPDIGSYEAIDGIYNAPIAAHTYDSSEFLPLSDRFITFGGAAFNTGRYFEKEDGTRTGPYFWDPAKADVNAVGGTYGSNVEPYIYSDVAGGQMWENRDNLQPPPGGDYTPGYGSASFINGSTAYAEENGKDVLYIQVSGEIYRYVVNDLNDASMDSYERLGRYRTYPFTGTGAGAYSPGQNIYVRTARNIFTYWNLDNPGTNNENRIINPVQSNGIFPLSLLESFGLDYDPVRDRFLLWGGDNTPWELQNPDDLASGQWTLEPLQTNSSPVPNSPLGQLCICGKWKYIAALDVFLGMIDQYEGQIWAYKPESWQPPVDEKIPYIVSPPAGSVYSEGESIDFVIDSLDDRVNDVEIYANGALIKQAYSLPLTFTWFNPGADDYSLSVVTSNTDGVTLQSADFSVVVAGASNQSPAVTLTAPQAGAAYLFGESVEMAAVASDNDGSISLVEFYQGGTKLGEDTTAPYTHTWSAPPVGNYMLSAVATDDDGASTTSASVGISITTSGANLPPTVQLTSPLDGASFDLGDAIDMAATASDSDGDVTRVEFYQGSTKLGEDSTAPYLFTWSNPPVGTHTLSAVAIDNENDSTTSATITVSVEVAVANIPPEVALTAPLDGANFIFGDAIEITATASDADGNVTRVEFYQGDTKLGEDTASPYTFTWNDAAEGSYTLSAVATDNAGATTQSAAAGISVAANPNLQAVELQEGLDGYDGTRDAYIYEYHNLANFGNRDVLFDNAAGSRLRSLVQFAIFQSEGGPVPDGATITSATLSLYKSGFYSWEYRIHPLLTSWLENEVTWETSRNGIPWSAAGATGAGTDFALTPDASASAPWDPGWVVFDVTGGVDAISRGRANRGWSLESTAVAGNTKRFHSSEYLADPTLRPKLAIRYSHDGSAVNRPPSVSLTTPLDGASYLSGDTIELSATASDSDGSVTRVEFYQGSTRLGEDTTAPYTFTWSNPTIGSHTLTAVATDDDGDQTTSPSVTVTVESGVANVAPAVDLTQPLDGTSFLFGDAIYIEASASDADGSVARVEFYQGNTKLGEDTAAPYAFTWHNAQAGNYSIVAVATDDDGASTQSAARSISVIANPNLVSVKLQEGFNGYSGTRDAYIYEYHNLANFGNRDVLFDNAAGSRLRSLVQFAIFESEGGPVPDGATITSATLSLYKSGFYSWEYRVHPLLTSWLESEVTWETSRDGISWSAPGATGAGTDFAAAADGAGSAPWIPGWVEFDVTAGVDAISHGRSNMGWSLESVAVAGNTKRFHSSEYLPDPSLRPKLTIEYTYDGTPSNAAPSVALSAPQDGASYLFGDTIDIAATASDLDGSVTLVEFYQGSVRLGEDDTAPYTFTWDNAAIGNYTLSAVATDDDGDKTTSPGIAITVESNIANVPPVVEMTSPQDGASYIFGGMIELVASASDADGSVTRVEFYQGDNKLGEDTSAPYTFSWTTPLVGNYSISAVATDDDGDTTRSAAIGISVLANPDLLAVELQEGLNAYSGTKDAYIYEFHNLANFGNRDVLYDNAAGSRLRSLVQFAIFQSEGGPVPDGATITSATLSLYKSGFYSWEYQLHPLLASWQESEVTWETSRSGIPWSAPGATGAGTDFALEADGTGSAPWIPGWVEFDVTDGVDAISHGRSNRGWSLESTTVNGNTKRFHSSEYLGDPALRPKLSIEYRYQ